MRFQLALNVRDLDEAIAYYSKLFDAEVNKRQPGYANFAIAEPPLKLVLFEQPDAVERLNHVGVEAFDQAEVDAAADRFRAAGLSHEVIQGEHCCYAQKNTVYANDPQGLLWEVYEVTGDLDAAGSLETQLAPKAPKAPAPAADANAEPAGGRCC